MIYYTLISALLLILIGVVQLIIAKKAKQKSIRLGIIKVLIPKAYSSFYSNKEYCTAKISPTGVEYENGLIEIKILKIIDFNSNSYGDIEHAKSYLKKNFKQIDKKDIVWESYKPLVYINEKQLNSLLNNKETIVEDNRLKLSEKRSFDDIIRIMLE